MGASVGFTHLKKGDQPEVDLHDRDGILSHFGLETWNKYDLEAGVLDDERNSQELEREIALQASTERVIREKGADRNTNPGRHPLGI